MLKFKTTLLLFFIVIFSVKYFAAFAMDAPEKIVAKINGIPVFKNEFEFTKQRLRTECLTYFTNRYGIYDHADFWQHSFNGEVPEQWLYKKAIDDCKTQKLLLTIMNRYGILKGFTYLRFKQKWEQENIARANQIKRGGIVYGTVDFDDQTYYTYLISNALLATKQEIVKRCNLSEKQWNTYYEKVKTTHFKKLPSKQIMLYKCGSGQITDSVSISFGPLSNKTDDIMWGTVYTESLLLNKVGQQSNRFQDAGGVESFIKCTAITDNGFFPFSDMIDNVKMIYADNVINHLMQQLKRKCVVN